MKKVVSSNLTFVVIHHDQEKVVLGIVAIAQHDVANYRGVKDVGFTEIRPR